MAFIKLLMTRPPLRTVLCPLDQRSITLFFAREAKIEVWILGVEFSKVLAIMEILNCFLIALADLDQMLREFMSFRITMIEINREVATFPAQSIGIFVERLKQLKDLAQLLFRELRLVLQIAQAHFFSPELNQDPVQLRVVVHILHPFLAGDLVERRLGDVHEASFY